MSIVFLTAPNPLFLLYERSYAFGPVAEGDQGSGGYIDLFTTQWRLTREKEIVIEVNHGSGWVVVPEEDLLTPVPELGRRADRKLTFAFDTAGRLVFAWENVRDNPGIFIQRYNVVTQQQEVLGPFPGVDSAIFNDAEVSYSLVENNVVLTYLSEDRLTLHYRLQEDNYSVEYTLTTFDEPRYLVGLQRMHYQFGVDLAYEEPHPKTQPPLVDETFLSDFYPVRERERGVQGDARIDVMRTIEKTRYYPSQDFGGAENITGDMRATLVVHKTSERQYKGELEDIFGDMEVSGARYIDAFRTYRGEELPIVVKPTFEDMEYYIVSQNHATSDEMVASVEFEDLRYISISQTIDAQSEDILGQMDISRTVHRDKLTKADLTQDTIVGDKNITRVVYRDTVIFHPEKVPSEIDGLIMWLKADAVTGVADGALLNVWEDSSTAGNSATANVPNRIPTYHVDGLGFLPTVAYDGDDFHQSELSVPREFTVFAYFQVDVPPADSTLILGASSAEAEGTPTHDFVIDLLANGAVRIVVDGHAVVTRPLVEWGQPTTLTITRSGDTIRVRTTHGSDINPQDFEGELEVNDLFTGDLSEVVVYNRVLLDEDRRGVETYLFSKYPYGIHAIPELAMWLDSAGLPDGEVYSWSDKSGRNINATQPTTGLRPVVTESGVEFSGTEYLDVSLDLTGYTIYWYWEGQVHKTVGDTFGVFTTGATGVLKEVIAFDSEISAADELLVMDHLEENNDN